MHPILVVDDDKDILSALQLLLKSEGYYPLIADSPNAALAILRNQNVNLILMDLNYSGDTTSGDEGLKFIQKIRQIDEHVGVVVMTGWGTIELAVTSIKTGANDFVQKPWDNDRLLSIIANQIALSTAQKCTQKLLVHNQILQDQASSGNEWIVESNAMKNLVHQIHQIAPTSINVLLTGENGTGKSLIANYIHKCSNRDTGPFVSVNMGAVTESLFESEMFGHIKGAFTDAKQTRIGRFELAEAGTLFLDEIANTPYSQQAKLLRVLEEGHFEKVGSSRTQTANIRLICATNAILSDMVQDHRFRSDLFYRINGIEIHIPPLRMRRDDILPLAQAFLARSAKKTQQSQRILSQTAEAALLNYSWPGNVRELRHIMERAQLLSSGSHIHVSDLGLPQTSPLDNAASISSALKTFDEIEIDVFLQRLDYFRGDALKAAKSLGVSKSSFYRRLDKIKSNQ